jgi:hypothetical protein
MRTMNRAREERTAVRAVLSVVGVVVALAASCSSGTSREQARDQATTATCQRYVMCDQIGAGKAYPSEPDCEIQWTAYWDKAWPAADCDGKIDQSAYGVCLNAIGGTSCTNILDLIGTLAKCGKMNVCDTATSPDGG